MFLDFWSLDRNVNLLKKLYNFIETFDLLKKTIFDFTNKTTFDLIIICPLDILEKLKTPYNNNCDPIKWIPLYFEIAETYLTRQDSRPIPRYDYWDPSRF